MKIERYVNGQKVEKSELNKIQYDSDVFDLAIENVKRRVNKKIENDKAKTQDGSVKL